MDVSSQPIAGADSAVSPAAIAIGSPPPATSAGELSYVSDHEPGIRRRRNGRGFSYLLPDGQRVRDAETLRWIRSLAIPPAWTEVWISTDRMGHILATGRDAKGRKQYRYHPRWREMQDASKFDRILAFAQRLPEVRKRLDRDLARPSFDRRKVLAVVVRLLEATLIRIGNVEYARLNKTFGLTTMRDQHFKVNGAELRFAFRGKSGKKHDIRLHSRRLATLVKQLQDLPGQELFQYYDSNGERLCVTSADVNAYLRELTGESFTAKDFRTWGGTILAAAVLRSLGPASSPTQAKRNINQAIRQVASRLGNTPAICRKSYIHPEILAAYLDGQIVELPVPDEDLSTLADPLRMLAGHETALMEFLKRRSTPPLAEEGPQCRNGAVRAAGRRKLAAAEQQMSQDHADAEG